MSDLEAAFDFHWRALDGPELEAEAQLNPARGWKFDRVHLASGVIIEIEGGAWKPGGGRHNRGAGFRDDCIKYNWTQAQGYVLFRLTTDMLRDDPAGHLEPIIATISERMEAARA